MKKLILISLSILIITACNRQQPTIEEPIVRAIPYDLEAIIPSNPYLGNFVIPEDNPMTEQGIELGRMLFYEKMLSVDNSMSCASCHKQEFAFTDGLATSKGIDGISGDRSSMALVNLLWDEKFFWDGRENSLEDQALRPIENPIELHQKLGDAVKKIQESDIYPTKFKSAFGDDKVTADRIAKAIAQFERTLISTNSKYDKYMRGEVQFTSEELYGMQLMQHPEPTGFLEDRGGNCADCHKFNNFTDPEGEMRNNGVDETVVDLGLELVTGDSKDRGKMKIPTLRNIAVSAPYMHDGRFNTLEEVLNHYNHSNIRHHENVDILVRSGYNNPVDSTLSLTETEKNAIIAFLKTLTDEEFLTNPAFSNPFEE